MRTILLTGICGGMGGAAAERLIGEGFRVYGIDVKAECPIPGVTYFRADLSTGEGLGEAFEAMKEMGAELNAIAHFSGVYDMDSLIEISEESFLRIFRVNLFGVFRVNKTFFPLLAPSARIIMVSSELAPLDPLPFTGLYGFSKTAVEKYAFSLRQELNLLGHSVIVIRPGAVKTGLLGDSTAALDRLCAGTRLYSYNADRFRNIVNNVENKTVSPDSIADILIKALSAKHPKYVYNINRNPGLRLLNILPAHLQVKLIGSILKPDRKRRKSGNGR